MDHGFSAPFDLDSLRSKVEGRFESVGRGEFYMWTEMTRCGLYSFLNVTSHRIRFLLFVKHLAVRVLTRQYRKRQLHRPVTKLLDAGIVDVCLLEGGEHFHLLL